jgi:hypothetical protein
MVDLDISRNLPRLLGCIGLSLALSLRLSILGVQWPFAHFLLIKRFLCSKSVDPSTLARAQPLRSAIPSARGWLSAIGVRTA